MDIKLFLNKCCKAYYNTSDYYVITEEDIPSLQELGFSYAEGTPVNDEMFDKIQFKAAQIDNKIMESVGASVDDRKVKLPMPSGSMVESHLGELDKWLCTSSESHVISSKLDGCSLIATYENGKLIKAYSRGDGIYGQDITALAYGMKNKVSEVKNNFTGTVRGELILKKSEIPTIISRFYNEMNKKYKNGRNMVAGQINSKEPDSIFLEYAHFVTYYIDSFEGSCKDMFDSLQANGFEVAVNWLVNTNTITEDTLQGVIQQLKANYDYEIDGIIITQNNIQPGYEGFETGTLNPKASRKYKVGAAEKPAEVKVTGVHWQISKSGRLSPVIEIEPVVLDGATVSNASGKNYSLMVKDGIGIGSKVIVSRRGGVIPNIDSVVESVNPFTDDNLPNPFIECTNKNGSVELVSAQIGKVGVNLVYTGNDERILKELKISQFVYFGTEMGLEFFGPGNVRALLDDVPMLNIESLLKMPEETFVNILGENGHKVFASIQKAFKEKTLATFYSAVDVCGEDSGIGEKKLEALLLQYNTLDLTKEQIVAVAGWSDKSADKLLPHINDIRKWKTYLDENKFTFKSLKVETTSDKLKDVYVVFTGVRDNKMENFIKENSGNILSSVSKKCNLVIAKDPSEVSTKLQKARENGIKIISYNEALELFK